MQISKLNLFLQLGKYCPETMQTRIVNVNEFVGEYASLALGNGGSWCRLSNIKHYKMATMKRNGIINCLWDIDEPELEVVTSIFKKHTQPQPGNNIQYLKVFGIKEPDLSRPIRDDIRQQYKTQPCVVCGSCSELVCDHKNDLYNDPRVLNRDTQTMDDFQSLCNHCNLQKRQVMKTTRQTGKRYGATMIPGLFVYGIDFTQGDETLDMESPSALIGTYWYDPIQFHHTIMKRLVGLPLSSSSCPSVP